MDNNQELLLEMWKNELYKMEEDGAAKFEYNIFKILKVTEKEKIMCNFLADLLNPEGEHGSGTLFLKTFLEGVLHEYRMNETLLENTDVETEYQTKYNRRIDIVIKNAQFLIPIEVKIYAGEQNGQCYDYYEEAKNAKIVYLTRFGDIPSECSRTKRDGEDMLDLENIICISWAKDIYKWLSKLLIQLKEPAQFMVAQYIEAIRSIAGIEEDEGVEKNLEILLQSPEYFRIGLRIEQSMNTAKVKLIRLVFDEFKKEMETVASKYGLELEKKINYYLYDDEDQEQFYGEKYTYPGLNYVVKKAKFERESLQMWFRIEVESNLYAGFTLFDTKSETEEELITEELIIEAAKYLERDIIMPVNWWLASRYSNGKRLGADYADVPNFEKMNSCAINLVDNLKRKQFVKNTIKIFEYYLLQHLL